MNGGAWTSTHPRTVRVGWSVMMSLSASTRRLVRVSASRASGSEVPHWKIRVSGLGTECVRDGLLRRHRVPCLPGRIESRAESRARGGHIEIVLGSLDAHG